MSKLKMPDGFTAHNGGPCPVKDNERVEVLIRTAEGFGSAGVMRAGMHDWNASAHEGGIGAVVGYRLADSSAPAIDSLTERKRSPGQLSRTDGPA